MTEKKKRTRVAAYGLIVDQKRILLCRISDEVPDHAGKWTLPGGGLDFGEDPVDGMVREVLEETGLNVRSRELADIDSLLIHGSDTLYHGIRILYHADVISGELTNELSGSTDKCGWFTHAEAMELQLVELAATGVHIVF